MPTHVSSVDKTTSPNGTVIFNKTTENRKRNNRQQICKLKKIVYNQPQPSQCHDYNNEHN